MKQLQPYPNFKLAHDVQHKTYKFIIMTICNQTKKVL